MTIMPINIPANRPARIIVLNDTPSLGMKMMSTRLFQSLRHNFPDAKIGVLTDERGAEFYKRSPYNLHILEIPRTRRDSVDSLHSIAPLLQAANYDIAITLPLNESHYYYFTEIEKINFPNSIGANTYLSLFALDNSTKTTFSYDVEPPVSIVAPQRYMGEIIFNYLKPLGITTDDYRPEAWSTTEDKEKIDSLFKNIGVLPTDFLFTINLRANQNHNQWNFLTLVDFVKRLSNFWSLNRIENDYGRLVIGINYVFDEQRYYFDKFNEILKNYQVKTPVFGLPNNNSGQLSQIIARSNYVLTQETGTAHVAQALDIPATVVYPDKWIERGWRLQNARVMPIISPVNKVSSENLFFDTMNSLFFWCKK